MVTIKQKVILVCSYCHKEEEKIVIPMDLTWSVNSQTDWIIRDEVIYENGDKEEQLLCPECAAH